MDERIVSYTFKFHDNNFIENKAIEFILNYKNEILFSKGVKSIKWKFLSDE